MLKQIRNFNRTFIYTNKGLSIIEVLVAVGLMSIVSVGVMTMMQNTVIDQKKNVLMSSLRENKLRIENIIRDQGAWSRTVNGPLNTSALWTNLRNNSQVTEIPNTNPEKVVLYDAAGNVAFNLLDWDDTTGNGFTDAGAACTTFTTAGNDSCPVSYRVLISADCGAPATCINPQLKVVARLIFRPSTTGMLNRFLNLVSQVSSATIDDGVANEGRYDAVVKRTATQVNSIFTLRSAKTATNVSPPDIGGGVLSACLENGGGICSTGTPGVHPLTASSAGWTTENDPASLVTVIGSSTGEFTIDVEGTYDCTASLTAFGTSLTGYLYRGTTPLSTGSAVAGKWGSGTVSLTARFDHGAGMLTQRFTVRQLCQTPATDNAGGNANNIHSCSLGYATQPYTPNPTNLVTVDCTRVTDPNQ